MINLKKLFTIFLLSASLIVLTGCNGNTSQSTKEQPASPQAQADGQASQEQDQESYTGNLEKIMNLGVPLKCTWKMDENYYGTAWIKGENSYSEVYNEGQTAKIIVKDNCMWSWSEENQGVKACFEDSQAEEMGELEEGMEKAPTAMETEEMRPPQDVSYNCSPAVFGDDKFNPPAEVEFVDMDQMMQGIMPEGY